MDTEGTEVTSAENTSANAETTQTVETPINKEAEALKAQLGAAEKRYKELQGTVNKKDNELKKILDLRSEIEGIKETNKILAAMIAEGANSEDIENIPRSKKTDYLAKFNEIEQRRDQERQQREINEQVSIYREKVEALGLTEEDPDYWKIHNAAINLRFKEADALINKIEKKSETDEKPKESQEDLKKKWREEWERERLDKSGGLTTETGLPAGGAGKSFTEKQIAQMSPEEYKENREEIQKAIAAGRVKKT